MSNNYPIRPMLLKGAFVVYDNDAPNSQNKIIAFQYNPEKIGRTLVKRTVEEKGRGGGDKGDILRTQGPPKENIKLTVQLNTADQLAIPSHHTLIVESGLLPTLSMLEMLLYPGSEQLQKSISKGKKGKVQFSEWELPLTLLVWGESRVVPVLLKSFSVTEEAFDTKLNPTQAKVELGLQVLTPIELKTGTKGYDTFITYLRRKETLAGMYQTEDEDVQAVSGLLP